MGVYGGKITDKELGFKLNNCAIWIQIKQLRCAVFAFISDMVVQNVSILF
jgi:hypothetical protein